MRHWSTFSFEGTVFGFEQGFALEDALAFPGCDAIGAMPEFMVRVVALEDALGSHDCWG
jgi:hypothetical protein